MLRPLAAPGLRGRALALGSIAAFTLTAWCPAQEDLSDTWPRAKAVLEQHCVSCHGGEKISGGLSFASSDSLSRGGGRGPAVDLDQPAKSRLLEVIGYANPELSMPPTGQLHTDEIAALTAWVKDGARWPVLDLLGTLEEHREDELDAEAMRDWWAYRPLEPTPIPSGETHPIDVLLNVQRAEHQLSAAPEASPTTLIRRATFDLLGLPPSPYEVETFVAAVDTDGIDAAWSALIERLLSSPHHGEQWGRHWLDLVRYAESNGYERDSTKANAWRYRDYVVRAHTNDKPYDQFVLEQLAGDQLDLGGAAADEARIATGFYRLMVWDDEPSDRLQARADELADVVDTTTQVFLASTLGCARCHDHKADPFTQRDYYAVTAWFNHITPFGEGHHPAHPGGGPTQLIADAAGPGVLTVAERDSELAALESQLIQDSLALNFTTPDSGERRDLVLDARTEHGAAWNYLDVEAPEGWATPGFDDSAWPISVGGFGRPGTPGGKINHEWTNDVLHLRTTFRLEEIPQDLTLTFHHDEDIDVFLNGQHVFHRGGYRRDYTEQILPPHAKNHLVVGRNVLAVRCRNQGGGQYVDVGLRTGRGEGWEAQVFDRLAHWARNPRHVEEHPAIAVRVEQRTRLLASPVTEPYPALVVIERDGAPPVQHLLARGSAHAPAAVVEPGVPGVLVAPGGLTPEFTTESSDGRRLAFAKWLVEDGAFITARVQANRLWQFHFGRGLCRTPGDFGRLGRQPTHPELLDHLAIELIERGWSLHALHRYIMGSAAYRMSSVGDAEDLAADPRNDHYHRFDPRRLRAEEFRDAVLLTNGALNRSLYGRSVRPPLAAEVLATSSQPHNVWPASPDINDSWRRSIYVHVKRSLQHPLLGALDQPDPDLPCPDRFPTNVPTQALITLNGDFVSNGASLLVERMMLSSQMIPSGVEYLMKHALSRTPSTEEIERNEAFVQQIKTDHGLSSVEALQVFCIGLYNRNEFLWID
jgi:mono/diheme cytochrome c family protein